VSSPSTVNFVHKGVRHLTSGGQRFSIPRAEGFRDTPTSELKALVAEVRTGQPWRSVVASRFAASNPWLHSIISDPCRTAFFENVLGEGGGLALDIGAGWGQITRPLASRGLVVALEPVAERLDFIDASARQEGIHDRIIYVEADYLDLTFDSKFSIVCAIGVFEWVGAFQNHCDPQERQRQFLKKIRSELAPGGHLVLGIENRIGLKYLLGCPDDHLGVAGIACLPASLAQQRWLGATGQTLRSFTYSHGELRQLLLEAGFTHVEFFGAFPDYKLPKLILPFGENGHDVNAWLADHIPPAEHNGYDGSPLTGEFSAQLNAHYRTLALEHTAHAMVPSFFVRAS
jgi:SAM-dependent methyltransferase